MSEEDFKYVVAIYQKKCFDLLNQNIIFEAQINSLNDKMEVLNKELQKLKSSRSRKTKSDEDFT